MLEFSHEANSALQTCRHALGQLSHKCINTRDALADMSADPTHFLHQVHQLVTSCANAFDVFTATLSAECRSTGVYPCVIPDRVAAGSLSQPPSAAADAKTRGDGGGGGGSLTSRVTSGAAATATAMTITSHAASSPPLPPLALATTRSGGETTRTPSYHLHAAAATTTTSLGATGATSLDAAIPCDQILSAAVYFQLEALVRFTTAREAGLYLIQYDEPHRGSGLDGGRGAASDPPTAATVSSSSLADATDAAGAGQAMALPVALVGPKPRSFDMSRVSLRSGVLGAVVRSGIALNVVPEVPSETNCYTLCFPVYRQHDLRAPIGVVQLCKPATGKPFTSADEAVTHAWTQLVSSMLTDFTDGPIYRHLGTTASAVGSQPENGVATGSARRQQPPPPSAAMMSHVVVSSATAPGSLGGGINLLRNPFDPFRWPFFRRYSPMVLYDRLGYGAYEAPMQKKLPSQPTPGTTAQSHKGGASGAKSSSSTSSKHATMQAELESMLAAVTGTPAATVASAKTTSSSAPPPPASSSTFAARFAKVITDFPPPQLVFRAAHGNHFTSLRGNTRVGGLGASIQTMNLADVAQYISSLEDCWRKANDDLRLLETEHTAKLTEFKQRKKLLKEAQSAITKLKDEQSLVDREQAALRDELAALSGRTADDILQLQHHHHQLFGTGGAGVSTAVLGILSGGAGSSPHAGGGGGAAWSMLTGGGGSRSSSTLRQAGGSNRKKSVVSRASSPPNVGMQPTASSSSLRLKKRESTVASRNASSSPPSSPLRMSAAPSSARF